MARAYALCDLFCLNIHDKYLLYCRENGNLNRSTTPTTKDPGCIPRLTILNTVLIRTSTSLTTLAFWVLIFGRWERKRSSLNNNVIAIVMIKLQQQLLFPFISGEIWHDLWQLPDHRRCEGSRRHCKRDMGCDKGMLELVFFLNHILSFAQHMKKLQTRYWMD